MNELNNAYLPNISSKISISQVMSIIKQKKMQIKRSLQKSPDQQQINDDNTCNLPKIIIQRPIDRPRDFTILKRQYNSGQRVQKQKHHTHSKSFLINQKHLQKDKQTTVQQTKRFPTQIKQTQKQSKQTLIKLLSNIPKDIKKRDQYNLQPLSDYLCLMNPIFSKMNQVVSLCFLKLNQIQCYSIHECIYKMQQQNNHFYIILVGKVKLINKQQGLRKICLAGETFGQQLIFSQKNRKITQEKAKAASKVYALEIRLDNYRKMKQQMIKNGYKIPFMEAEAIFKRNFIVKNTQRNRTYRCITRY